MISGEYPKGYVKVLPKLDFSYHRPLLICQVNVHHVVAPNQFWFKRFWLLDNSYYIKMKVSWGVMGKIMCDFVFGFGVILVLSLWRIKQTFLWHLKSLSQSLLISFVIFLCVIQCTRWWVRLLLKGWKNVSSSLFLLFKRVLCWVINILFMRSCCGQKGFFSIKVDLWKAYDKLS